MKLGKEIKEKIWIEVVEEIKEKYPGIIENAEEVTVEVMGYITIKHFWEDEKKDA